MNNVDYGKNVEVKDGRSFKNRGLIHIKGYWQNLGKVDLEI